jgi:hypothetical protein
MGVRLCYKGMSPNQWLKLLLIYNLSVLSPSVDRSLSDHIEELVGPVQLAKL